MTDTPKSFTPGLLSVIVPVYKVEQYLSECVDSLLKQTYKNIEIILVDDGSPDRSGEMADEYASRFPDQIRVIHKPNGGASSARNVGLDAADGEFIGFVDSDDMVLPEFYDDMVEALRRTGADMAGSYVISMNGDLKVQTPPSNEKLFSGPEALASFYTRKIDSSCYTKIFRRHLLSSVRFIEGIINEDMIFLTEVYSRAENVVYLPKAYYLYRTTPGSVTNVFRPAFFDCIDNLDRVKPIIDSSDENVKDAFRYFSLFQHIMSGVKIVRSRSNRLYKDRLRQNRRYIRRNLKTLLTHRSSTPRMVGKAVFCFLHLPFKV